MQISIILDQRDSESIVEWASQGPIWLRQLTEHAQIAGQLRRDSRFVGDHVTTFVAPEGSSIEEAARYILDTVTQHHPTWTRLVFVGLRNGAAFHAALLHERPCKLTELNDRVIIER